MLSEVRRYLVYTDRGAAAADFEARMALGGAAAVADLGDGRRYYLWTDVDERSADLEARLAALGFAAVPDLGVAGQRDLVFTMKGELAADFEKRIAAAIGT